MNIGAKRGGVQYTTAELEQMSHYTAMNLAGKL